MNHFKEILQKTKDTMLHKQHTTTQPLNNNNNNNNNTKQDENENTRSSTTSTRSSTTTTASTRSSMTSSSSTSSARTTQQTPTQQINHNMGTRYEQTAIQQQPFYHALFSAEETGATPTTFFDNQYQTQHYSYPTQHLQTQQQRTQQTQQYQRMYQTTNRKIVKVTLKTTMEELYHTIMRRGYAVTHIKHEPKEQAAYIQFTTQAEAINYMNAQETQQQEMTLTMIEQLPEQCRVQPYYMVTPQTETYYQAQTQQTMTETDGLFNVPMEPQWDIPTKHQSAPMSYMTPFPTYPNNTVVRPQSFPVMPNNNVRLNVASHPTHLAQLQSSTLHHHHQQHEPNHQHHQQHHQSQHHHQNQHQNQQQQQQQENENYSPFPYQSNLQNGYKSQGLNLLGNSTATLPLQQNTTKTSSSATTPVTTSQYMGYSTTQNPIQTTKQQLQQTQQIQQTQQTQQQLQQTQQTQQLQQTQQQTQQTQQQTNNTQQKETNPQNTQNTTLTNENEQPNETPQRMNYSEALINNTVENTKTPPKDERPTYSVHENPSTSTAVKTHSRKIYKPNYILLVTYENVPHKDLIQCEYVRKRFAKFGRIQKIICYTRPTPKSFIQFHPDDLEGAIAAKTQLNGNILPMSSVRVIIEYSKRSELTIRSNNKLTFDYTVEDSSDDASSIEPTNTRSRRGVLLVTGFNVKEMTPQKLFNLFSCYGFVEQVKIFFQKRDHAFVQYSNLPQALHAAEVLNNCRFYNCEIQVARSKQSYLRDADDIPVSLNRFSRTFAKQRSRTKGPRMCHPTNTIHVTNLPPNTSNDAMKKLFQPYGKIVAIKFFSHDNTPMCLIRYDKIHQAIEAICGVHNTPSSKSAYYKVSFSTNTQF